MVLVIYECLRSMITETPREGASVGSLGPRGRPFALPEVPREDVEWVAMSLVLWITRKVDNPISWMVNRPPLRVIPW
jgi:hypothetical protein